MKASTRVVVNTGVQYLRTIISIGITLYTSRIVLANLGDNDYGIYSLIGGVVSMLAFIQNNLASTTQRYLSYYRGKGDDRLVMILFNNSVCAQLIIAITLCLMLASSVNIVFNHIVNITPERITSARIVYWLMIGSLFINLQSTPYLAVLISRENIVYSSVVQMVDAILKIPIAISLIWISKGKLEWYSFMTFGIVLLNYLLYFIYCKKKYFECRQFKFSSFDIKICKSMFSFIGWNSYGTGCVIARTQGTAILLNNFFGTAINAAFGIANQLAGQLSFVSSSLTTAINPQIIKAEGAGNRNHMFRIAEISCKFSSLLFSIISIPAVIYMPTILSLWLENVPEYTAMFCSFIVISTQVDLFTLNLNTASQAIGNVKAYNLWINSIKAITIIIVYVALRIGMSPTIAMVGYVFVELICSIGRVIFDRIQYGIPVQQYARNVLFPIIPVLMMNIVICTFVSRYLTGILFILTGLISVFVIMVMTYVWGLKDDEREIFHNIFKSIMFRIKR